MSRRVTSPKVAIYWLGQMLTDFDNLSPSQWMRYLWRFGLLWIVLQSIADVFERQIPAGEWRYAGVWAIWSIATLTWFAVLGWFVRRRYSN